MDAETFNLFFALFPDQIAAAKIANLAKRLRLVHGLSGKPLAAKRFHVSLYNLGSFERLPEEVVSAAERAAMSVKTKAFRVTFDRAQSFAGRPDRHPFVLLGDDGLAALNEFHIQLGAALRKEGLGRFSKTGFTPHVTLLYGERLVEEHPVESISWDARKFVLVRSHTGKSRYERLGEWPLAAPVA